jgi:hypothetical protein
MNETPLGDNFFNLQYLTWKKNSHYNMLHECMYSILYSTFIWSEQSTINSGQ